MNIHSEIFVLKIFFSQSKDFLNQIGCNQNFEVIFHLNKFSNYPISVTQPIISEDNIEPTVEAFKKYVIPDIQYLIEKYSSINVLDIELNEWFRQEKRMNEIHYASYPLTRIILGLLSAHFNQNPQMKELKEAYWHEAKKKKHEIDAEGKELIKLVISKI